MGNVKRNVELAKNASANDFGIMMTEEEQKRLEDILNSDNEDSDDSDSEDISSESWIKTTHQFI